MVSEAARTPIDGSASIDNPSVPDSTITSTFSPSSRAPTTKSSASAPRGTIDFTPVSTRWSPSRVAVVCGSSASNNGRGSVSASAAVATSSPVNAGR